MDIFGIFGTAVFITFGIVFGAGIAILILMFVVVFIKELLDK